MEPTTRWIQRYTSYYQAYYQELLAGAVIGRWQTIDLIANLFVTITAGGSTVSGLAFWKTPWGTMVWGTFGVVASLASIVHGAAHVPARLKRQGEARREFSLLRGKLQDLLYRMGNDGDSRDLQKEYSALNSRQVELTANLDLDLAATAALRNRVQNDLNGFIDKLGITQGGIIAYERRPNEALNTESPPGSAAADTDSEAG